MECKDVLIQLREKNGLSQQELADRMFITRQAVSRWERGETLPSNRRGCSHAFFQRASFGRKSWR